MGERPDLSGEVLNFNKDRVGSIALWENEGGNDKQPDYTGTVGFRNGKKRFRIAVWVNEEHREKEEGPLGAPRKFPKNWKLENFVKK